MIIGLQGFINCGKGTVASYLVNQYGFKQDSFANSLKDVCSSIFGWPRELLEGDTLESREWREIPDLWWSDKLDIHNFSPRLAFQTIGTDILRNKFCDNIWSLSLENRIRKNFNSKIVFSDIRFPNEIAFLKEQNGILIKINRTEMPVWYDVALSANINNDQKALHIMHSEYSHVHYSEWAWIGSNSDYELDNSGSIENLKIQIDAIMNSL